MFSLHDKNNLKGGFKDMTNKKPKITTKIRRISHDDIPRIIEILNSQETEKFITKPIENLKTYDYMKKLLSQITLEPSENGNSIVKDYGIYRVIEATIERTSVLTGQQEITEDIVGFINLYYAESFCNTIEFWCIIDSKYRNKGIGTWCVKGILKYIESDLLSVQPMVGEIDEFRGGNNIDADDYTIARIQAKAADGNIAFMKVLEKSGFVCEGIIKKSINIRNEFVDCLLYSFIPSIPIKLGYSPKSYPDIPSIGHEVHNTTNLQEIDSLNIISKTFDDGNDKLTKLAEITENNANKLKEAATNIKNNNAEQKEALRHNNETPEDVLNKLTDFMSLYDNENTGESGVDAIKTLVDVINNDDMVNENIQPKISDIKQTKSDFFNEDIKPKISDEQTSPKKSKAVRYADSLKLTELQRKLKEQLERYNQPDNGEIQPPDDGYKKNNNSNNYAEEILPDSIEKQNEFSENLKKQQNYGVDILGEQNKEKTKAKIKINIPKSSIKIPSSIKAVKNN